MMNNWLKSSMSSIPAKTTSQVPYHNVNRKAALAAFKRHWIQILEVLDLSKNRGHVLGDEITVVSNHFAQTIDYLIVDLLHMSKTTLKAKENNDGVGEGSMESISGSFPSEETENTPIFDHFMSEQILHKVLQWSLGTGEHVNHMKLEQLKAYEKLLAQSSPEMLVYQPILTPLLDLLNSCSGCNPMDVEKRLLVLLNQLCVSLMNNPKLVEYFFHTSGEQGPTKFLIFSLLLPFVHREGIIGQHARDVLLLCMALSASYPDIGVYIAQHSNFCPVLATGLSGLYSMLPRSLPIETEGWYRFSSADIAQIPSLKNFINSLEFCNAVVQVSHPLVRQQIVEFLYQGFLVPVLGPALFQSSQEDLVTALAYMELALRTVTEKELQRAFLALLLVVQEYGDLPLVTALISHLHSSNITLRLVALGFFSTLLELHSEDAMVVLIFQYLCPCNFVMLSQRPKLAQPPYGAAQIFLSLVPTALQGSTKTDSSSNPHEPPVDPISSFTEYLSESHLKLSTSYHACKTWSWQYDGSNPSPSEAVRLIHTSRIAPVMPYPKANTETHHYSLPCTSNIESLDRKRTRSLPDYDDAEKNPLLPSSANGKNNRVASIKKNLPSKSGDTNPNDEEKHLDSLGGSSGYESFNPKTSRDSSPYHNENLGTKDSSDTASVSSNELNEFLSTLEEVPVQRDSLTEVDDEEVFLLQEPITTQLTDEDLDSRGSLPWASQSSNSEYEEIPSEGTGTPPHPKPSIGPFLEALLLQIDQFLANSIHVGLLAMSCLSTLASYPTPLLTSLLLKPSVVLQPSVRSLYQVLSHLKMKIDDRLVADDIKLLRCGRDLLISQFADSRANISKISPAASPPSFRSGDPKRHSISHKMGAFFKWATFTETPAKDTPLQNLSDGSGYRYINRPSTNANFPSAFGDFYSNTEEKRHAALVAILFQEWLFQLSSLSEEHTVWSVCYQLPRLKFPSETATVQSSSQ